MTPFQQFRLWLRDGPSAERVVAGAVAVLAAVLFAWGALPIDSGTRSTVSSSVVSGSAADRSAAPGPGTATTVAAATPAQPTAAAPSTGGSSPAPTRAATPAAPSSSGAACPAGSDQGVDDQKIRIAAVLPNIQGQAGNQLVGLPSYDDEVKFVKAAVADQNKRGGAACRQLDVTFYDANPIDAAGAQQRCLEIAAGKYFAVIDSVMGYIAGVANCLPQRQLPTFQTSYLLPSQIKDFYPYDFSLGGRWDSLLHDWAQALKEMGWFDPGKGFKKLGLLIDDCFPEVATLVFDELGKAGIAKPSIEVYDFGGSTCNGIPPANQYQQAVLNFERAGVTHVADVVAPTVQSNYFSRTAGAQRAKFAYTTPDRGAITTFESSGFSPDPQNYDGAIAITQSQYGALKSGVAPSAATKRCNEAMAAAGMPSVEQSGVNFAGSACNFVWMIAAAISKAPVLKRTEVVTGLNRIGAFELSYPTAPVNFNRSGLTTGGHFWRAARYDGACGCFKLLSPTFRPNFP